MEALWERIALLSAQIERTKRVLEDAETEAAAIQEGIRRGREETRRRAAEHRWLRSS